MAELGIIPTGYERLLPPEAQLLVRQRRTRLAGRTQGRVLDLGGSDAHTAMWASTADAVVLRGADDPRLAQLARDGERFDTVLSVAQLVAARDLPATLTLLRQVLAPGGQVLFLEPARQVGVGGRVQRLAAPGVALLTGWRLDRDVVAALRDAQLSVTAVQRHRVATAQPWLRRLVEGRAHHALEVRRDPS